jgi:hypothetical protein
MPKPKIFSTQNRKDVNQGAKETKTLLCVFLASLRYAFVFVLFVVNESSLREPPIFNAKVQRCEPGRKENKTFTFYA